MKPIKQIIFASVVVGMLGGAQLAMAAVDPSTYNGSTADQVHRQREPFTDGAHDATLGAAGNAANSQA